MPDSRRPPVFWAGLLAVAGVELALHLFTNLRGGYGYFRDELYYLACADHLGWGYVDHPPLSIWLLAAWRGLFGSSLFALRLLPALAGTAASVVTGLLARELGGGRWAQGLAALGAATSIYHLAVSGVYSMNAYDLLLWAAALLLFTRLLHGASPRLWVGLGLLLGVGLLNKVGVLWLGAGIAVATLATPLRRSLKTRWPWLGAAAALLLFSPYLLWNAAHDLAHLEFIRNAVSEKYSGLDAWSFVSGQGLVQNPVNLLLWPLGLVWLLVHPPRREDRALAWVFLAVAAILLANGHSKAEYLSAAFAIPLAAGGIAWERLAAGRRWLAVAATGVLAAGFLLAPLVVPILPVERYVRYADALGVRPHTAESKQLADLPQFYADMFGWPEKARAVAQAYDSLSAEERAAAAVFAGNYGRAGAVDFFGRELGLPPAVCSHNSYWIWGPGDASGAVTIVLGGERADLERRCEQVELAATASCEHCMPYESDLPVWICRRLRAPLSEIWPAVKNYS